MVGQTCCLHHRKSKDGVIINKNFSLKAMTFIFNLKGTTNIKVRENFEFRKKVKNKI